MKTYTPEKQVAKIATADSVLTPPGVRVHSTAIVERDVRIGAGTAIWDHVHIRHSAQLGEQCIVGEKTYIAQHVQIGNRVKINAFVFLCYGVTIEDGVMISAGVIFTNDRFPRATTPDLGNLRGSDPDEGTLPTFVREGATIGAGSRIGCDLVIGRFAMVGMGSVVTRSVPDFALVMGSPSRLAGYVCRCGQPLIRFGAQTPAPESADLPCEACGRRYLLREESLVESDLRGPRD